MILGLATGIVGVIQYQHNVNSNPGAPKKEAGSSGAAQPVLGSEYELVAAVSGIRAQVYGEDFQEFMQHGATQRSSVHAYIDLFCYQAPASRHALRHIFGSRCSQRMAIEKGKQHGASMHS